MASTDNEADAGALEDVEVDAGWELPEVAAASIVASVALLVVSGIVSTLMSTFDLYHLGALYVWTSLADALRSVDPVTVTVLLAAAGVVWWQYGRWTGPQSAGLADDVVMAHVRRLRTIAKWNAAAFVAAIAMSAAQVVASVAEGVLSAGGAPGWAFPVGDVASAMGAALLAVVGVVALRRVLDASATATGPVDEE